MKRVAGLLVLTMGLVFGADKPEPGTLPDRWRTGGPDCALVPDWEVHAYNPDFLILRESGCVNYEKPFLYLIFGEKKVLLEDTGAGPSHTAAFVTDLIARWANTRKRPVPALAVIHSHLHGDHTSGDADLHAMPGVEFVDPAQSTIDLGGRVLDVLAIPGQVYLDAHGHIVRLVLNKAHPLAAKMQAALQQLLAQQNAYVCLGEI